MLAEFNSHVLYKMAMVHVVTVRVFGDSIVALLPSADSALGL